MRLTKRESKEVTVGREQAQERWPRFQIVKLEERIAPRCKTHKNGKKTGHCGYY